MDITKRFLTLDRLYETAIRDWNNILSNFGQVCDTDNNPLEYACCYNIYLYGLNEFVGAHFLLYDLKSQAIRFLMRPVFESNLFMVHEDSLVIKARNGLQPWYYHLIFEKIPNSYAYTLGQKAICTQLGRPSPTDLFNNQPTE